MSVTQIAQTVLQAARVAPEIFQLRSDYRALLIVVEGIPPGPSDEASDALLQEAETYVQNQLSKTPATGFPHIAAWRETYKAFGAKPQKTRNSLEALTRRAEGGLPRVNRLTDIYNAISVKHQIPLGGEDLDKYIGSPFLIRAAGHEQFQTFSAGEPQAESAAPGEPVWCDDAGVTCRRWNWRQGPRTALTDETTRVLFILDALAPLSDESLVQAADELVSALKRLSSGVRASRRIIDASAPNSPDKSGDSIEHETAYKSFLRPEYRG
ncbi:Phenylalanyl-tRNA synthetase [Penicillium alfredii]|uniref:Phenylalanyl-tRNA synthetase n=1 Tax=Penicillium alfredii TaxID=1506179 RepID=A0A9W9F0I8_9EURO|nr:Phenylalanyl-tRNA synthetase [Penicillium alfredii]KAJ5091353.1 Phenylalanyl-tRNA synthetase [Penicillium alfredii]